MASSDLCSIRDLAVAAPLTRRACRVDDPSRVAPADIKDEATIRVAGYLYDQPTAAEGDRFAFAFRSSGAAGLLSPWVSKRAGEE